MRNTSSWSVYYEQKIIARNITLIELAFIAQRPQFIEGLMSSLKCHFSSDYGEQRTTWVVSWLAQEYQNDYCFDKPVLLTCLMKACFAPLVLRILHMNDLLLPFETSKPQLLRLRDAWASGRMEAGYKI